MEHGETPLAGPLWFFAQFLVLAALALVLFVLIDSLRPARRADVRGRLREPLWLYTVLSAAFLALTAAVQLIPGVQGAAALVAASAPVAVFVALAYLLRVVFPRRSADE